MDAARLPGVARGAWHTVEDLAKGAYFVYRLQNPLDPYLSAPGESAKEQFRRGADHLVERGKAAIANPHIVVDAIERGLDRANRNLNPSATPQGRTIAEEVQRNVRIGLNQGELAFDVASTAYGGAELKGLALLARRGRAMNAADYIKQGVPPRLAEYFATPYTQDLMGHHVIARNGDLAKWMGDGPVAKAIIESPFFVLKPKGLTKGEFFKRHYQVDSRYRGGNVPREFGGRGWSGARDLGWTKHGRLGRMWYGTTPLMKGTIGGGIGLGSGVVEQMQKSEEGR